MAYDWLGLGRVINRAYPPSDPTDYIEFIIPLLCLGGLYRVTRSYKELLGKAPLMVSVGLILTGAFHFSEAYLIDSNIPFGLIFLFIGHLFDADRNIPVRIATAQKAGGVTPSSLDANGVIHSH